jgi:hypothetical protein
MKAIRVAGAVVCLLVGLIWFFQGLGIIRGSMMTGQPRWSAAGLVLLALAVWQLVALLRARGARP